MSKERQKAKADSGFSGDDKIIKLLEESLDVQKDIRALLFAASSVDIDAFYSNEDCFRDRGKYLYQLRRIFEFSASVGPKASEVSRRGHEVSGGAKRRLPQWYRFFFKKRQRANEVSGAYVQCGLNLQC